jgi:hypothetical protein
VTHDDSDLRLTRLTYPSGQPKTKNKKNITALAVNQSRATKDQGTASDQTSSSSQEERILLPLATSENPIRLETSSRSCKSIPRQNPKGPSRIESTIHPTKPHIMSTPSQDPHPTTKPRTDSSSSADPFESLLSLEEQYHAEGRTLGLAEGEASGRIEGRVFGLEKSFEKFVELGRMGGRGAVWSARLPPDSAPTTQSPSSPSTSTAAAPIEVGKEDSSILGPLPGSGSERLVRHVRRLVELTNAEDVSRENSEDGVQDFDDRLREAKAKGVLIERLVGEGGGNNSGGAGGSAVKRAGVKGNAEQSKAKSGEMEDFLGLPRGAQK